MCEPTGFNVNYVINPYMKNSVVDAALALRQWRSVKDALVDAGASVTTVKGDARYPDMVFAANAAQVVTVDNFKAAIMAKFRSGHRAGETQLWAERMLAVHAIDTIISFNQSGIDGPQTQYFEGQGDVVNIPWRRNNNNLTDTYGLMHYIVGYGQRTSIEGMRLLSNWLFKLNAKSVTPIKLKSGYFYHLDTCLFVGSKVALWIPGAIEDEQHSSLKMALNFEEPERLIMSATVEEGKTLCCNMVEASPGVVVSGLLPPRIRSLLKSAGYSCIEVDTSEFIKAGGSVRCMTLDL